MHNFIKKFQKNGNSLILKYSLILTSLTLIFGILTDPSVFLPYWKLLRNIGYLGIIILLILQSLTLKSDARKKINWGMLILSVILLTFSFTLGATIAVVGNSLSATDISNPSEVKKLWEALVRISFVSGIVSALVFSLSSILGKSYGLAKKVSGIVFFISVLVYFSPAIIGVILKTLF